MFKKLSMKKKIFLLVTCLLVIIGAGTSSGRKFVGYAISKAGFAVKKTFSTNNDSVSIALLQKNYRKTRDSIETKRLYFEKKYNSKTTAEAKKAVLKEAGAYLRNVLRDKVYPTWYGTEWDYNGITETPGKGQIACGYFVSTTLRHTGVNVNRFKLAQKYSHAIVKSICTDEKVFTNFEKMLTYLKTKPDDLYVVGLDNHVGMISKKGSEINFIHSSFVYPSSVTSEAAANSSVLGSSNIYVLGNMTANSMLIRSWLTGAAIKIVE
jgi:hypothetical protein